MGSASVPYSTFLRGPNEVLPRLATGDVVLERRDDENVILSSYERFLARRDGMAFAARLLGDLAREQREVVVALLERELPWMRWLPREEREQCVEDLMGEFEAGAHTGVLEPFVRSAKAWQATAEIWSDPDLVKRFTEPMPGDGPEIERPSAAS